MPPAAIPVLPDEAAARRLLLARALDEADAQGRLVGAAEKLQAGDEALRATTGGAEGAAPDPLAWLQARARRIAELLDHRSPSLAALAHASAWESHAAWLLPLGALAAGAFIDRIDNPRQVNLLSPPLLAFLLWNIGVYLLLLVHAAWPRRAAARPFRLRIPWRAAGVRAEVAAAFQRHWWALGGAVQAQRWRRILHASAAAWGLGVALSIVLGGVVREYRVGWESTLLDLPQVHAVLHWMFAPVGALLGIEPFSMAEVARLHFGSGEQVTRVEARRWVALYLGLVALVVILPRAALAAWAAWRERMAARTLRIDLDEPYYAALLSRVTPARVRVAILASSPQARERLDLVLQQMGGIPPGAEPWTVLATQRGDTLQVVRADELLPDAPAATPWWRGGQPAVTQRPPFDVLLLAGDDADGMAPQATEAAVPVVAIGLRAAAARTALPWSDLPTWREDARLWSAMAQACPAHLRTGAERLWQRAHALAQERLRSAVQMLADELVQDVLDVEPLPAAAVNMRQLVVREERDAAERAGREATAALLDRLQERQRRTDERLLALHALTAASLQQQEPSAAAAVRLQRAVDAPQAGLAGAASGAAMGAGIDLVTGGLTLGAASALGALVGGGAAMVAAAWRNARGEAGASSVMLDDAAVPLLVRDALLRYLAIVHAGRSSQDDARGDAMQRWSAALDAAAVPLEDAARLLREQRQPRSAGNANPAPLERALASAADTVLQRLHGDVPTPAC